MRPHEDLQEIVDTLNEPRNPDPELCLHIGVGDLENLLRGHEEELWPEVERLARENVRFRRALAAVWAYDSPAFERRDQLLHELGESITVGVRFVAVPTTFDAEPPLEWRAVEIDGPVPPRRIAPLLREIADWMEERAENQ